MSVTFEKIEDYLSVTELASIDTSDEAIAPGGNKKYQTTYGFRLAKQRLQNLLATVTDQEEKQELQDLLDAIKEVPTELSLNAIRKLTSMNQLQDAVFDQADKWVKREANSSVSEPSLIGFIKSLGFLLTCLQGDVEGPGPKTVFGIAVLDADKKAAVYEKITLLLESLGNKSMEALKKQAAADLFAYMQDRVNAVTASIDNHTYSTIIEDIIIAQQDLDERLQLAEQRREELSRLQQLEAVLDKPNALQNFWQQYQLDDDFNQLMCDLDLDEQEQAWWHSFKVQYWQATNTDMAKSWLRYFGSFTRFVRAPLSVAEVSQALNAKKQSLQACMQPEAKQLDKPCESLDQMVAVNDDCIQQYTDTLRELGELNSALDEKGSEFIMQALHKFVQSRSLLVFLLSSSYRKCYSDVKSLVKELNNSDESLLEQKTDDLQAALQTYDQDAWRLNPSRAHVALLANTLGVFSTSVDDDEQQQAPLAAASAAA